MLFIPVLVCLLFAFAFAEEQPQTVNLRVRAGYAAGKSYTGDVAMTLVTDIVVNAAGQQIAQQNETNSTTEFVDNVVTVDAAGFPASLNRVYGDITVELLDTLQQTSTTLTPLYANKTIHLEAVDNAWTAQCEDTSVTQAELTMLAGVFGAQKGEFELLPDADLAAGQTWEPDGEVYTQSFLAGFKAGLGLNADAQCALDDLEISGQVTTVTQTLVEYEVDISCTVTAPMSMWTLVVGVETAVHGKLTGSTLEITSVSTLTYSTPASGGEAPENSMSGTGEMTLTFSRTENE